ncbi:MAG: DNA glycosylase [Nanoarchaeota archaeon]|nr:DNA glycosylase [Nanoarchaeota archaeon]
MESIQITHFNLRETLYSGQFFNFREETNGLYTIVNGQNIFQVKQEKNIIYYVGVRKDYLIDFFDLDFDEEKLSYFSDDVYFNEAFNLYRGLKIMNIDLFQTIISFVCSAASNQKKIENNIRLISKTFGIFDEEFNMHRFPTPEQILSKENTLELLLECKVGYRAKYILSICEILVKQPTYLSEILRGDYTLSHKLLMNLPGVGSKVADCICLFGLHHMQAFPVDTWIKKILSTWYAIEGSQKQLELQAKEKFGDYGGYIQQYLFHYAREKKLL